MKIDVDKNGVANLSIKDIADNATPQEITSLIVGIVLNIAGGYSEKLEEATVAAMGQVAEDCIPFFSQEFLTVLKEIVEKKEEGSNG